MKTKHKLISFFLMAAVSLLIFESCAPRYSSGRYRPRKKRSCRCPAYGFENARKNKTIEYYAFVYNNTLKQIDYEKN